MLSMQPDVVVPELYPSTSINRRCSSDVDMNYDDIRDADGCDNLGYTAPEKFDGIYRHHGGNDPIANGGKLSLAQSLMNGDLHRSPTRLQYVPPASSSPHGFPIENGRTTSPTKRQSPIDKAAAVASAGRPSASGSLRSTPLSAQKEDQAPTHPADENNLASAARGRNLRTTPTVGLTIDEVDRITESRRCTPAVPRTSTTSSDDDDDDGRLSPDIVNRTDFTRDDLELVVAPQPQRHSASLGSTSSDDDDDETNYDTFTNSDYEYAASRRPRSSDFNDPYRLRMPPPSATNAAQPPPPRRRRGGGERLLADPNASAFSSAESTIDDSFSVDGGGWRPASAGTAVGPTSSGRSSVDILRAAELLGWGFKVDQLVDVFIDIAALPDGGSGRTSALAVGGGRSPAGSSVGGAMRDEHPVTHRPQSASSGSRINGEKRSSRRSPAESFDRPTSSPSAAAAAGQQNGARPSSTGSSTYSNQSSAIGGSAAGGGLPGSGRRSANGTATPQLSSSRPVSSASEADNPYLDAQPYIIATGSRPSSSNSGRSTADAFATAAGGSRTTKTPTPTNRNVSASSPLGMIREDDDAVTNNSSTVPSLAYGRQTVLEEYV
jgi:hypothetical protein